MNALVPLLRSAAQVALSLRERKAPLLLVLLPLLLFLHPVAAQAQTPLAHVNFAYPAENTVGVGREDNGSITVVVSLMYAPAQDASVQWTLSDGTAKGGTDFKGTGGTLTFTKGTTQLTQTITIETINNGSADGVRYGWIELSNPTGCILDMIQNKGKFYIYDDDAPITASFGAATYSIGEKGMKVDVQVKLSAACPNTVKVEWTSAGEGDNPAKSPQHYYPASGYVEFKPGDTSKTVSINILDNSNSDMDRKAKFSLGAVTGGPGVGAPDSATLTIVDDESPPAKIQFSAAAFSAQETAGYALITVNLDKAAAALVSVNYQTANGTAKAGVHYSAVFGAMQFQPGETSKTFQVPLTYQAAAEGDRTVNLSLSFPSNNAIVVSPASTVLTITEVPLVLSLREVTFWNHHVVYANDGDQGPYQGPHWLDGNGNGDLADAGDRSHPVCYTRNTKMQVSAKFAATSPVPVQGYVWIKGTGPNDPYGKSLSFPEVQISLTNLEAYMGLTVASNPFQDEVGSYQPLSIFWSFSVDNKATWVAAGTSQNEVFVTLAAPIATPYYGLLDLSCAVAQGQKEESTVFEYGWKCFEKKNIMVRTSLNAPFEKLYYYGSWTKKSIYTRTTATLLKEKDGDCVAWAKLFIDFNRQHGIKLVDAMRVVRANDLNEGILVKKWLPKAGVEPGSNKLLKSPGAPSGYSYVNIAKNELPEKEINGVWQYEWASAEVEDKAGIAGQNNENPASLFGDHVIAFVQEPGTNKYYDPCYGMTYESSADIEAKVIDFYTRNTNDVKEYFIRPNVLKIELNAKLVKY